MDRLNVSGEHSKLLMEFTESMTQAIGAANQFVVAHGDPRWWPLRDALTAVRDTVVSRLTFFTSKPGGKMKKT